MSRLVVPSLVRLLTLAVLKTCIRAVRLVA